MKTNMAIMMRKVEVRLPKPLHHLLTVKAKAEKKDINTLILSAIRADVRRCRTRRLS